MHNLYISGCNRIQEIILLHKLADEKLPLTTVEIVFLQEIQPAKGDSLWYGGEIVSIMYEGYEFVISADGDVRGTLFRVKDNSEVTDVRDKCSNGEFNEIMSPYIKNDAQLHTILNHEDTEYDIVLDDNNWYELMYVDKNGQYKDLQCALDDSVIFDAIASAISMIPEFITEIKEEEDESE